MIYTLVFFLSLAFAVIAGVADENGPCDNGRACPCLMGQIEFCNESDYRTPCTTVDVEWYDCFEIPENTRGEKGDTGSSWRTLNGDTACELWESTRCNGKNSELPISKVFRHMANMDPGKGVVYKSYRCYVDPIADPDCVLGIYPTAALNPGDAAETALANMTAKSLGHARHNRV